MIKIANLSRLNNQRGAVGLEFTIIFPLLLMVTFGIVEFGTLMFDKATLTDAVRQGARAAIAFDYDGIDPACSDLTTIQNRVETVVNQRMGNFDGDNYLLVNFDPDETPNITVDPPILEPISGEYVIPVKVEYTFHFIFIDTILRVLFSNNVDVLRGGGIPLDVEVKMRGEDQYLLEFLAGCP